MSRLADRVRQRSLAVLGVTLAGVGLLVAVVLHLQARTGQDRALITAVQAHAYPHQEPDWYEEAGGERLVPVQVISEADAHPAWDWMRNQGELQATLLHTERGRRYAVLDLRHTLGRPEAPHHLVIADAAVVHWTDTAAGFLPAWALVSALAWVLAGFVLRPVLRQALQPLEDAVDRVSRVVGLSTLQPLDPDGPDEVRALLVAVNDLLSRLQTAFDAASRFSADAAHELRTPVTVLRGELELALSGARSEEALRTALERLQPDVLRLGDLVDGLVALTRLDAGHVEQAMALERPSAVVHAALAAEQATLEASGNTVQVALIEDPEARLHATLLRTALGNLLRNAARHAPGTAVTVRVDADAQEVRVDVIDEGPGLPQEGAEQLFARHTTTGQREGLGLGLPLARAIARRHGGDCLVVPSSHGAHFRLTVRRGTHS